MPNPGTQRSAHIDLAVCHGELPSACAQQPADGCSADAKGRLAALLMRYRAHLLAAGFFAVLHAHPAQELRVWRAYAEQSGNARSESEGARAHRELRSRHPLIPHRMRALYACLRAEARLACTDSAIQSQVEVLDAAALHLRGTTVNPRSQQTPQEHLPTTFRQNKGVLGSPHAASEQQPQKRQQLPAAEAQTWSPYTGPRRRHPRILCRRRRRLAEGP